MTVHIGVIGAGMIGQDHIRRLTEVITGAAVTAVTDIDQARAAEAASRIGAAALPTGSDLVRSPTWTPSSSPPGAPPTRSTFSAPSRWASRCSARSHSPPPPRTVCASYAATVITDAAVQSLESGGQIITVDMKPRPAFYGATS